jgi:hypothetical protein
MNLAEAPMAHPATKRRGADPHVPEKPKQKHQTPNEASERKLEQGLEETMAGSDPVSIVQPVAGNAHKGRKHKR